LGQSIRLVKLVILAWSFLRLIHGGTSSGIHSSQALTILSNPLHHLIDYVSGLGHLGGVEHQVDVVVLRGDSRLERGTSMTWHGRLSTK
jgi:hypothetical protein